VVFIHYKAEPSIPNPIPIVPEYIKKAIGYPTSDQVPDYRLIAGGIKWKETPVAYYINPNSGLGSPNTFDEIKAAFETWDSSTSKKLFIDNPQKTDKVGAELDGYNVVSWQPISDSRIIAATSIWYYRYSKEIVEVDIVMNSNQPWGIDLDGEGTYYVLTDAFDIRNIATHEVGHFCGLNDLYMNRDRELTMYGYSALGEVKKISLGLGDILGVQKLYGA
jgi:hypothetical protein